MKEGNPRHPPPALILLTSSCQLSVGAISTHTPSDVIGFLFKT